MTEQKLQCQDLMDKLLPLYIDITHPGELMKYNSPSGTESAKAWVLHGEILKSCRAEAQVMKYYSNCIDPTLPHKWQNITVYHNWHRPNTVHQLNLRMQDAKYYNLTEVHQLKLSL
ncbi:hypothetical protein B0H11DRAFT_1914846 [Mycena galericulata]|nr:hypothetical protein B0H11DRAFT_1916902 [Mycena galericulata]KAJ7483109.1 hypothetical protein B0H11DRAFT_1914846 [Mycena galericulata]